MKFEKDFRCTSESDRGILKMLKQDDAAIKWYLQSKFSKAPQPDINADFITIQSPLFIEFGQEADNMHVRNGPKAPQTWRVVLISSAVKEDHISIDAQWDAKETKVEAYAEMVRVVKGEWESAGKPPVE
ncbi:hypothetical protein HBI22_033070 [Parastagonospora nodorum]|nr:hypothetical protein HBI28_176750 [Parastagonospora nodorum]KAH5645771.1 hypothetical protein HBI22_033070 [Parastagonospora nodorum]